MPDINSSRLAKQFGVTIRGLETLTKMSKKGTTKLNVCVPGDEMEKIRNLWKHYESVVKEHRHRKVVDKLRNITHLGQKGFQKNEKKRLSKLLEAFQETDDYMHEAEEFFKNCKGHNEIKKYVKQIDEDYKTLFEKKGYLRGLQDTSQKQVVASYARTTDPSQLVQANNHLDRNRFMVWGHTAAGQVPALPNPVGNGPQTNPYEHDYAGHVSSAYIRLYTLVNNFCQNAGAFLNFLETTKNDVTRWDTQIDYKVDKIREYCTKFRECANAVKSLAPKVAKCDDGKVQGDYERLCTGLDFWGEKFDNIDRRGTMNYIEAIFYNAVFAEHTEIMSMTQYIIGCAANLDRFAGGITSGSMTPEKLRETFRAAVKDYERLNAILTAHTQNPGTANATVTFAVEDISGLTQRKQAKYQEEQRVQLQAKYDDLCKDFDKLGKAFMNFEKTRSEFLGTYYAWEKEKKEAKRRAILFAVFAGFAVLSQGLAVFNPLLEGAIMRMPAPVEPLPSKG